MGRMVNIVLHYTIFLISFSLDCCISTYSVQFFFLLPNLRATALCLSCISSMHCYQTVYSQHEYSCPLIITQFSLLAISLPPTTHAHVGLDCFKLHHELSIRALCWCVAWCHTGPEGAWRAEIEDCRVWTSEQRRASALLSFAMTFFFFLVCLLPPT